jgi:AraC-like DNA-binding protein
MPDRFRITPGWARRLAQEGICVATLLRRAGLPDRLFEQERIQITTSEIFALWRAIAELAEDPGLGLRLGIELRFERSHPLAIAGVCSRSFDDALQRIARYKRLTCPEEVRVRRHGQEATVEFHFPEAEETEPDIMVDVGLSWILNVARRGSDGAIRPLRVELVRAPAGRKRLEGHFGCPVRFGAGRNAMVFRDVDLDRPFVTHNEELATMIGAQLESELGRRNWDADPCERVRRSLRGGLAGRRPTLEEVAKELGLGTRSLQRRLSESGTTFQALLEEVRREMAHRHLQQPNLEFNEVAFLLGYEDTNSFFRAFQGWEGKTPSEWRSGILSGPDQDVRK